MQRFHGPNGLLGQAEEAKTATKDAEMKEKVELEIAGSYDLDGKVNKEKLEGNLKNLSEGAKLTDAEEGEEFSWKVTVDGYIFNVWDTGKVENAGIVPEKSFENTIKPGEKVTKEQGNTEYRNNGTAIIPVGFSIVPGCDDVSEGLVISDDENDKEIGVEGVVANGNQFVWIPVTDANSYDVDNTYGNPNISANLQKDIGYLPLANNEIGIEETMEEEQKIELTFAKEKEMVTKEGIKGFYVSRYEAGKENTDTLVSKKGANIWVSISQEEAKGKAKEFTKENTNVKSALISGVQWDKVMKFVNGKKDGEKQTYDVKTASVSRHDSEGMKISGQNLADKVCNIYDLEGNCYEYVAEKNKSDLSKSYVIRGGYFNDKLPASWRIGMNNQALSVYSFRFVLYVM